MDTIQTDDHRLILNESGALLYPATEDMEDNELHLADAQEFQYRELVAIADYVNTHRERFVQIQLELERLWLTVADDVINYMEAERKGSAVDASINDTQRVLALLASAPQEQRGSAGCWYQPVLAHKKYPSAFFQQWVPFLRILRKRKEERFPTAYAEL